MTYRMRTTSWVLIGCLFAPAIASAQLPGGVQVPGTGQLSVPSIPSKTQLLGQSKQMVTDLTSMKSSGKLAPDQAGKVDALLPKATALNTELEKPQVEASRLSQLAKDLSDLQKQVGALKALVK